MGRENPPWGATNQLSGWWDGLHALTSGSLLMYGGLK
jgi:hypothetical protein